MARRKVTSADISTPSLGSTPSQQDEGDIIAEIGATPSNDGNGELEVDEAKIRDVGAVDAESVRENRRGEEMVNKVRGGQKGVLFNLDNVLEKYDLIIRTWPPNTIDILVNRVTGAPVQWVIQSRPRSGADLYAAILAHHGRWEEAEYEVRFIDSTGKQRRGTGRITMPDSRDTPPTPQQPPMQGQSMNPYQQQPPSVQVVPPAVDPVAMMRAMFDMVQQMQRPPQTTQPGSVVPQPVPVAPAPASFSGQSTDPLAMMKAMFEMVQQMQHPPQTPQLQQPQAQSQPVPMPTDPMAMMKAMFEMVQQTQNSQAGVATPIAASTLQAPSTDPLAVMQQAFEMFRKMQQPSGQPQQPTSQVAATPPVQTPPGMFHVPGFGFVPAERLFQALSGAPTSPGPGPGGPGPGYRPYGERPPYGGPRPYYPGPQGQQGERPYYPGPQGQEPQQQRPQTVAEQFREATSVVEMAVNMAERFRGSPQTAVEREPERADDDNPVRVVDVGGWPVIVDKRDGSARKWETVTANMGNVLKWLAEQREAIQKSNAEREAKLQRQQLPPGYVEVTPGYKPPRGYVAVPVNRLPPTEDELPQPPEHMPPPISQQQEEPPPRARTWGAPPIPGGGQ